jgi:hypothetical protein
MPPLPAPSGSVTPPTLCRFESQNANGKTWPNGPPSLQTPVRGLEPSRPSLPQPRRIEFADALQSPHTGDERPADGACSAIKLYLRELGW